MFVLIYYHFIQRSHCHIWVGRTHINNRNSAQQLVLLIAFECFWGMRVQKAKLPSRPSQEGRPDAFRQSISTVVPSSPAIPATRDLWILKMEVYSLWKTKENRIRFDMHWFWQKNISSQLRLDDMIMTPSPIHLTKGSRMRSSRLRFADSSPERPAGKRFDGLLKGCGKSSKKQFQLSFFFDSIKENVFVFE